MRTLLFGGIIVILLIGAIWGYNYFQKSKRKGAPGLNDAEQPTPETLPPYSNFKKGQEIFSTSKRELYARVFKHNVLGNYNNMFSTTSDKNIWVPGHLVGDGYVRTPGQSLGLFEKIVYSPADMVDHTTNDFPLNPSSTAYLLLKSYDGQRDLLVRASNDLYTHG